MKHLDLKKELLKDKNFAKEYYVKDMPYLIGRAVKKIRIENGLTQEALAKKLNTKQSSVARIENGSAGLPSLSFLEKIANVFETELIPPTFKKLEKPKTSSEVIHIMPMTQENYDKWQEHLRLRGPEKNHINSGNKELAINLKNN